MNLTNTVEVANFMPESDIDGKFETNIDDPVRYRYFHKYGIIHTGEYNCAKVIIDAIDKYDKDHKMNYFINPSSTAIEDLIYSRKWDGKVNGYPKSSYFGQEESHGFHNGYGQFYKIGWVETDVCMDHPDFNSEGITYLDVTSNDMLGRENDKRIMAKYLYTNYGNECYANFVGQLSHYDEFCSMKYINTIMDLKDFVPEVIFQPEQDDPDDGADNM